MNRMPKPGEIYQHFKGNLYRIVTVAEHTETGELLVVYQALYGSFQVYARPLSMFLSEVDHDRYPEAEAKLRFTPVPAAGDVLIQEPPKAADERPAEAVAAEDEEPAAEQTACGKAEKLKPAEQEEAEREEEFALDPKLLAFLEADSYEKKLEIYASLAGKADESMLNTIAVSMDLELSGDTLEEQYETLKNCLLMLEKYECNRLR